MTMGDNLEAPNAPRQPLARLGPSPRASVALSASGRWIAGPQTQILGRGHQDSTIVGLETPVAAGLAPYTWVDPTVVVPARRHSSMHDAALDVLQSTYPPPIDYLPYGVSPTQTYPQQQETQRYPSFDLEPAEPNPLVEVRGPQPSSHKRTER